MGAFPSSSDGKESAYNAGFDSIQFRGKEDPLEKGMAIRLWYSCLKSLMERGVWRATLYGSQKVGHN